MVKRILRVVSVDDQKSLEVCVSIGSEVEFRVAGWKGEDRVYRSANLFHAMNELRHELEQEGYKLLCNGARKDAYPSRMALDMGRGTKLYLCKLGVPAKRSDLVDILDEAELDQVCSIREQRDYHELWLRSLSR